MLRNTPRLMCSNLKNVLEQTIPVQQEKIKKRLWRQSDRSSNFKSVFKWFKGY